MKTITLVSLLLLSCYAHAIKKDSIGRVVKLRGTVIRTLKIAKKNEILKAGAYIFRGDEINSGKGSYAKIILNNDSIFQLGPNSRFIFENYKIKHGSLSKTTYNLLHGKLRTIITKKKKSEKIVIKTPNVAMGVRGTEILSDVYSFKGSTKTDIALLSGKLVIDTGDAKANKIKLSRGQIFESSNSFGKKISISKQALKSLSSSIRKTLKSNKRSGGKTFLYDARGGKENTFSPNKKFNNLKGGGELKVKKLEFSPANNARPSLKRSMSKDHKEKKQIRKEMHKRLQKKHFKNDRKRRKRQQFHKPPPPPPISPPPPPPDGVHVNTTPAY